MPLPTNNSIEQDKRVARYYNHKLSDCAKRGIAFNLNLTSVKNLLKAKRCYYTGILLTVPASDGTRRLTDFSIDRVNSSKPYEVGNVVACCHWANQLKCGIEGQLGNQNNLLAFIAGEKVIRKTIKHLKRANK